MSGKAPENEHRRVWFDVSPPVSPRAAVFPGDTPFSRDELLAFERGHHLALSTMHGTVHVGAHADAPSHYHRDGVSIDRRPLDLYFGECQVVTARCGPRHRIGIEDLSAPVTAPRVLIRTDTFPDPDRWTDDFAALSPALVERLATKGVVLVGIDTPSIDLADDKVLESHQAVFRHDMAILEGLVLDEVPDGTYTLIALPLRLEGADASPVRAVLRVREADGRGA